MDKRGPQQKKEGPLFMHGFGVYRDIIPTTEKDVEKKRKMTCKLGYEGFMRFMISYN